MACRTHGVCTPQNHKITLLPLQTIRSDLEACQMLLQGYALHSKWATFVKRVPVLEGGMDCQCTSERAVFWCLFLECNPVRLYTNVARPFFYFLFLAEQRCVSPQRNVGIQDSNNVCLQGAQNQAKGTARNNGWRLFHVAEFSTETLHHDPQAFSALVSKKAFDCTKINGFHGRTFLPWTVK